MEFAFLELWPKDASGTPEEAALLCTEVDVPGDITFFCSMLESFGLPFYVKRPGAGEYFHILYGRSLMGSWVEFYVPISRLEEAKELLNAPPAFDDELAEDEPEE